jgi:hypothetical protein
VRWEKLRILYNLILVFVVSLLSIALIGKYSVDLQLMEMLVVGCFVANLCYLVGPAVDGYLTWLGVRHLAVTALLFVSGTLLAIVLAAASFVMHALPGFDGMG